MKIAKKPHPKNHDNQVEYMGRWIDKEHFRVFVYNEKGEQTLANNLQEYETLIASGLWYASRPNKDVDKVAPLKRKQKYGLIRSDG